MARPVTVAWLWPAGTCTTPQRRNRAGPRTSRARMPYVSVAVALLATTPTPPAVSADPSTPKPTLVVPTMPLPQATVASMAPTWLPELPIVLLTTRVVPENLAVNVVVASTASLTAPCTTGSPALIASPRFADRLCRTVLPNSLGARPPQARARSRHCRDGFQVAGQVGLEMVECSHAAVIQSEVTQDPGVGPVRRCAGGRGSVRSPR